jgi:hypothetical protein
MTELDTAGSIRWTLRRSRVPDRDSNEMLLARGQKT